MGFSTPEQYYVNLGDQIKTLYVEHCKIETSAPTLRADNLWR